VLNLLGLGRYGAVTPRDMFHEGNLVFIEWRGESGECQSLAPIRLLIHAELGDSQYEPGPTCFGNDTSYILPLFVSVLVYQATKTKWLVQSHRSLILTTFVERLCWEDETCSTSNIESIPISVSMQELYILAELYDFDGNGFPDIESSFLYQNMTAFSRRNYREEIDDGRMCTMVQSAKLDPDTFLCSDTCRPDFYSVAATTDTPNPNPDPEPNFDEGESWEEITVTVTSGSKTVQSVVSDGVNAQYNFNCTQNQILPGSYQKVIRGKPVLTTSRFFSGVQITGSAGGDQFRVILSEGGWNSQVFVNSDTGEKTVYSGTSGPYHFYPAAVGTPCAQGDSNVWREAVGRDQDGNEVFRIGGPNPTPSPDNPDPDLCGPGSCTYTISFELSINVSLPVTLRIKGLGGAIRTFRHNMDFDLPLGNVTAPSFCGPDVPNALVNYAASKVGDGLSLVVDTIVDAGLTWAFPVAGKILAAIVDIEIVPTVTKTCSTSQEVP